MVKIDPYLPQGADLSLMKKTGVDDLELRLHNIENTNKGVTVCRGNTEQNRRRDHNEASTIRS